MSKMAVSHYELDSFLQKYKYLCSAGLRATVTFKSENCNTHVSLEVDLPFLTPQWNVPPPNATPQSPRNRSPSFYRRLKRRRDARHVKVESTGEFNVDATNEVDMPQENYSQNLCEVSGNTEEVGETIAEDRVFNIDCENATGDEEAEDGTSEKTIVNALNVDNENEDDGLGNDDETAGQVEVRSNPYVTNASPLFGYAAVIGVKNTEDNVAPQEDSLSQLRNLTNRLNILAEPSIGRVRK